MMDVSTAMVKLINGMEMPLLGLGTWKSKPHEIIGAVKHAIECGYRHIDCAAVYENESLIGEALSECIGKNVQREDLFITSKLGNKFHAAQDVRPAFEKSLRDLKLDYLDLYLIHWPYGFQNTTDAIVPRDEAGNVLYSDIHFMESWKEIEKFVDEGLVKAIGLSNFNSKQILEIIEKGRIKPAALQVECHPWLRQKQLIDFCSSHNIVVTAHCVLGSGDRIWVKPGDPDMLNHPEVVDIARKHNKTPAQVILRYQVQREVVAIPKSVTPARIKENSEIFDFRLTEDDIAIIESFPENRMHTPYKKVNGNIVLRDTHHPYYPFNEPF